MGKLTQEQLEAKYPEGRSVRYVPYHAEGNASHPDCENGIVSSVRAPRIFVRFSLGGTAQACTDDQLTGGIV